MSTTKAQIDWEITTVEVLCDLAATSIRSHVPTGLGDEFTQERADLERLLEEIPARFKAIIRRGQRHGWATK